MASFNRGKLLWALIENDENCLRRGDVEASKDVLTSQPHVVQVGIAFCVRQSVSSAHRPILAKLRGLDESESGE